jgi:hypothetical protein
VAEGRVAGPRVVYGKADPSRADRGQLTLGPFVVRDARVLRDLDHDALAGNVAVQEHVGQAIVEEGRR